jgi:dihydroorotate dehydrogenase electron transfer subunit
MRRMQEGERLDILWPLGNGYDLGQNRSHSSTLHNSTSHGAESAIRPLLIGGGAGVPPMVGLCRRLMQSGAKPVVILGFRSAEHVYYKDLFEKMGARTIITTEDGSVGKKGFVTDAAAKLLSSADAGRHRWEVFACGPEAMLQAIDRTLPKDIPGQMSFEERMGCGFGACMGCSCQTKYGSKRICKDGPVLERSEILW